jgi:hypothetical protein
LAPGGFLLCGTLEDHLGGKSFADDEEVETEVRKWLRQQSKDFYAAGFEPFIKRWNKCINVSGGYVEKLAFNVLSTQIGTVAVAKVLIFVHSGI